MQLLFVQKSRKQIAEKMQKQMEWNDERYAIN